MAKKPVSQIKRLQAEAQGLMDKHGMSAVDEAELRPLQKFVHFWVLVGKNFVRNRCLVRASALAYTTLLALIPLLAVGLGVSTTLLNSSRERTSELIGSLVDQVAPQLGLMPDTEQDKGEERRRLIAHYNEALALIARSNERDRGPLISRLAEESKDQRERATELIQSAASRFARAAEKEKAELIVELVEELRQDLADPRRQLIRQIQQFIANVHSGALGLSGTVGLFFVAIGLLSTIEATFNDIWGRQRGRNWFVRVIHYWAAITLGPLVIVLVMGLAIGSQFQAVQHLLRGTPVIGNLLFKLIPYFV